MSPYEKDIFEAILPDLSSLNGLSVLITGATGLIGKCITKMLHYHNHESAYIVYAGCRDIQRAENQIGIDESASFKYIEIDVTKPLECNKSFDYIIDAASSAAPNQFDSDPVGVMKANVLGVCNLLEYGVKNGLKRFLYISSGEVYGQGNDEVWCEDESGYVDPMMLRSAYPSSKRCAETLCVAYAEQYGVSAVVARLCHTYGPQFQEKDNRAYAQFFRNALAKQSITLKSVGGQIRSWIYVIDCATAILQILVNGKDSNAYNVANGNSNATVSEFAELVASIADLKVRYDIVKLENATPIKSALFNTSKLEKLGWHPTFGLKEGISQSINSMK